MRLAVNDAIAKAFGNSMLLLVKNVINFVYPVKRQRRKIRLCLLIFLVR